VSVNEKLISHIREIGYFLITRYDYEIKDLMNAVDELEYKNRLRGQNFNSTWFLYKLLYIIV
jgi:hypothetical protein